MRQRLQRSFVRWLQWNNHRGLQRWQSSHYNPNEDQEKNNGIDDNHANLPADGDDIIAGVDDTNIEHNDYVKNENKPDQKITLNTMAMS